ncbi:tRNA preQ1(34) S-adenosylmethionine ribosyltransferase-isomerase QueA [Pelotalea chapellei]|uniref:S-adenosylmethionine:tRNA ribosyltransferase-isomerase n=1 Tax=Pelotalea chapellei TaxID=44671 RepID=A0ABS5U7V4_9BACT|nr:tRNA preQ1(34) S-adenosylmethionine ribosyltransferase-isomerase QueA [Pelotalea chapellei]MBT1071735.1 tRNA preQ1(34) S-adenosylmethionine ribosyltransferase-isomerase QueA [Pelotalea chapellei]
MLVKDFDYVLPVDLIARFPAQERDSSRLMVLNRQESTIRDHLFKNIIQFLSPLDLLVMNDTRVIPARLFGRKPTGGKIEIFLVRRTGDDKEIWSCLIKGSKGIREGMLISLTEGITALVRGRKDSETWEIEFSGKEPFAEWLEREGEMPLPPYFQRPAGNMDRERYQTVFANVPGAVAAPTAGLHFTHSLLAELENAGIKTARLTLHTGLGTFQPVRVEQVQEHRIHVERYSVPQSTADAIRATKSRGGRVVAVGTTTARTLEFAADNEGNVKAGSGEADIFIYPGYRFKLIDALITNFHLPESTLLMMVAAFAGKDFVFDAYRKAIQDHYRFYSYGDAMLIV